MLRGTCRFRALGRLVRLLCLAAVFLTLTAPAATAQVVTGTIYGTVADPTGAGVPQAAVTATNIATGVSSTTTADAGGNYRFPSLTPGTYNIRVEKQGFDSSVFSGVNVLLDQTARVDARLQVGQVSTTVNVSGAASTVETQTASVGTVVGEQQIVDLPLDLRRITSLATLVPGTISASGFGYAAYIVGGSPFSEATYVAGGGRDSSNTLLIDGMETRAYDTGGFALAPPPDAIQEFKIQTNIYSAVFGKTAGSTMNTITKSGTNEFHGDAYEFLRNSDMDARNFFAGDRPEYRRNQFGATLGGPVRKNKTFFFAYYDALREVKGLSLGSFVPTDQEKAGNFSSVLTGQTANLCGAGGPANLNFDTGQLFNPATESQFTCPKGSADAGSTVLVGSPIPNNIITNIDPVAQKVLAAFPEPNRSGYPNYVDQTPRDRADNQFGIRLDHTLDAKDQIFGRYMFAQSGITDPSAGYSTLPGFGDKISFRGQNVVTSWIHTFGPHLLNEATAGFQRNNPVENCQSCPLPAGFEENFGIEGLKSIGGGIEQFPFFSFSNFAGVGDAGYRPISNVEMTEDYRDDLTWTRGRHNIVFGTDLQWLQNLRQQNPFSPGGQFNFNGQFTSLGGEIPGVGSVSDLADLETGYPALGQRSLSYRDVNQVGSTFWSFYTQDDIKLRQNLSINVGLRYEYRRPPTDKSGNIISWVPLGPAFSGPGNAALLTDLPDAENDALCSMPSHANLISATGQCLVVSSALRRQMGFTGRTQQTLVFPDRGDWAPRFGLAWRPTSSDKLVVRTGYGIFYDLANLNTKEFVSGNPIFSPTQIFNTTFGFPPPLTNGAPTTIQTVFAGTSTPLLSQQYSALYLDPHFVNPRVQEWSFGLESQLASNWALDVSYVGSTGRHLDDIHLFGNQPLPGVGAIQPRRPYPDFNNIAYFSSDADSNYNALQAKLTKRLSAGVQFLMSYTLGKTMSDEEGNEGGQYPQDDNNLRANWARAQSDAHQRFVVSPSWSLPIGEGQRWLNGGGILSRVVGDWELSGIFETQTGLPFTVVSATDFSNSNSQSPRPDRTCSGVGPQTVSEWFNPACFTTSPLQAALAAGVPQFGNSGRNILSGPGLVNLDVALIKKIRLSERVRLQFRAEAFNIFNHPNFGNPNATCVTTSTATCAPGPQDVGDNIGQISTAGDPRDIQLGLKLLF
jgi:hypothetical protein